jgi:hypothetical protein
MQVDGFADEVSIDDDCVVFSCGFGQLFAASGWMCSLRVQVL